MNVKLDWENGDYFSYIDYNRTVDNVKEVAAHLGSRAPSLTKKKVTDYYDLDDLNKIIRFINQYISTIAVELRGEFKILRVFDNDSSCWSATEINDLERDLQLLYILPVMTGRRVLENGRGRITEDNGLRVVE